jgi:very-short-patch-repair endonuclease
MVDGQMRGTTKRTVQKAKALRRELTPPEAKLWNILRRKNLGVKFRHQHPIGAYVLDFYCPAAKLCVEVDGAVHGMGDTPDRDGRRDEWLAKRRIRVLRVGAWDVMKNLDGVCRLIQAECAACPSTALRAVPLPIRFADREDESAPR